MRWGVGLVFANSLTLCLSSTPVCGAPPEKGSAPRTAASGPVRSITDWRNAGNLLRRSRQALTEGNLELAEWYASATERLNLNWESGLARGGDSPKRIREEIAKARGAATVAGNGTTGKGTASAGPANANPRGTYANQVSGNNVVRAAATSTAQQILDAVHQAAPEPSLPTKPLMGVQLASHTDSPEKSLAPSDESSDAAPSTAAPTSGLSVPSSIVDPASHADLTIRGADQTMEVPSTSKLLQQAARIQVAGQSPAPPAASAASSDRQSAAPVSAVDWQAKKAQALGWLAEAKAALDRSDLALADQFARAAQELRVPDRFFEAGDPRPWMLLMEVNKQQERLASQPNFNAAKENFAAPPMTNPLQDAYSGYDELGSVSGTISVPQGTPPIKVGPATQLYVNPQQYPATIDPRIAAAQLQVMQQQQSPPGMGPQGTAMMIPNASVSQYVQGVPAAPAVMSQPIQQFATALPEASPVSIPATSGETVASQVEPAPQNLSSLPQRTAASPEGTPPGALTKPARAPRPIARTGPPASPLAAQQPMPPKTVKKAPPKPHPELANVLAAALQADEAGIEPGTEYDESSASDSPLDPAPMVDLHPPGETAPIPERAPPPKMLVVESTPTGREGARGAAPLQQPAPEPRSAGYALYETGREALENQNLPAAEQAFKQAWKYEADFDPDTRQRLQDHLQMLEKSGSLSAREAESDAIESMGDTEQPSTEVSDAVRRLVSDVAREIAETRLMKESDPSAAWDRLQELKTKVEQAQVADEYRRPLLDRVSRQTSELEQYISQNRARLENDERNKAILEEVERRQQQRSNDEIKIAQFVEQFNDLLDQQRYPEALTVAKQARELDPRNPVVISMVEKGQIARQVYLGMMRNERFGNNSLLASNGVLDASVPPEADYMFPGAAEWNDLRLSREELLARQQNGDTTESERQIQKALRKQINLSFKDEPLGVAMEKISKELGINIYLDPEGLMAEGITSDQPVTLPKLPQPISLRSALNLMLEPLHLSYVAKDEVLRITSEDAKSGTLEPRTYNVADLVIPIPNFVPNNSVGLPGALREAHNLVGQGILTGALNQLPMGLSQVPVPLTFSQNNPTMGTGNTNGSILAQLATSNSNVSGIPSPPVVGPGYPGTSAPGGGSQADFGTLINLIQTTIETDSWQDNGGNGSIGAFPTNLSLVVTNTQDVHEKIVDLLKQLRRLQDLQVTIEVRIITLNDSFFERIGVDFDFNLDDNSGLSVTDLQRLDDQGPSITVGLDPFGVVTPDLDVKFTQGSFGATSPTFGRFDTNSVANIGFAILSDIEAFFLIQAAQGDDRSNVLQAPKVTLFDGQTASVSDVSQRPFVTSVIPVVGDFAAAHQPVITVLTEGTTLSVNAVVSNDRRFVRLTLVPFFSRIGNVDTFTFDGRTDSDTGTSAADPTDETQTVRNNVRNTRLGTTVQLPTLAFTTVNTTVSVPDGGTILLGGIKRLSEGRNERGVPMLSKIAYVNRLFRNVGIGRETQSLMLMVTPRIIIQEEEEEKLGTEKP